MLSANEKRNLHSTGMEVADKLSETDEFRELMTDALTEAGISQTPETLNQEKEYAEANAHLLKGISDNFKNLSDWYKDQAIN